MTDCDMIVWQAKLSDSETDKINVEVTDRFSEGPWYPSLDQGGPASQNLNTQVIGYYETGEPAKTYVDILTTRKLDTGDHQDFLIPLDEPIQMIYAAWTDTAKFVYHGENYGWFETEIPSDGSVAQCTARDKDCACC